MNSLANAVAGCGSSGRITIDLSRGSPVDKIVKALLLQICSIFSPMVLVHYSQNILNNVFESSKNSKI